MYIYINRDLSGTSKGSSLHLSETSRMQHKYVFCRFLWICKLQSPRNPEFKNGAKNMES